MFIASNQQGLIVHENVEQEKVLFSYHLELYIKHICLKLNLVKL